MSATAAPFGLRPVGNLSGTYNNGFRQYPILSTESTRICFGDVVKLTDAGSTTTIQKDTGTTSATPIGIFLGCRFIDVSTKQLTFSQQWSGAAHTEGMAYVADDPNILFEIQADGSVNDDDIAANCALVQGTSSAALGISRVSLDISTAANTAALPIRIVDFKGGFDGDEKGTSFPIMLCKFNTGHQLGIGVVSGNAPSAA
jgi:hypothetical protein|tara:strand:- start:247 stop:849 length:603 start_codon:yes stop_codon:yes gene_type:complete